jgi:hypothetical protein
VAYVQEAQSRERSRGCSSSSMSSRQQQLRQQQQPTLGQRQQRKTAHLVQHSSSPSAQQLAHHHDVPPCSCQVQRRVARLQMGSMRDALLSARVRTACRRSIRGSGMTAVPATVRVTAACGCRGPHITETTCTHVTGPTCAQTTQPTCAPRNTDHQQHHSNSHPQLSL